jgi:dTDP-4-dehydrorhamnose 3,5-epimerase
VIPEGFAHGFQTLSADCELLYFHTAAWSAEAEAALHPLDPTLGIRWPKPIAALSDRDRGHPFLGANPGPLPSRQEAA